MDGTVDQPTRRRRALRRWLFAYPLATLGFMAYALATSARTDVGEFLLLLVAAAVVALALPVLALIDGARCGAIGPALGGCLLGIVPALLLWLAAQKIERARYAHDRDSERERVTALVDASARGDRDAVRAAATRLPDGYGPGRALCIAGSAGQQSRRRDGASSSDDWLLPEPDGGLPRVTTARLFDTAETLMQGRSRAQRQDVLAALLVRLSERGESLEYLPGWLRLWRGTDAVPDARMLVFAQPRDNDPISDCHLDGDADLIRIVADTWHEDGLRLWIGAGYGFAPGQDRSALDGLRSKAGLDALSAAGLDLRAALRRSDDVDDVMYRLATFLPQRLDQSADPAALADLTDAYLRAGAELGRTTYGKTPCEIYQEGERTQARQRSDPPAPARDAAALRIREALCPQGRPPAATSSTTTPFEDQLEAASRGASVEYAQPPPTP